MSAQLRSLYYALLAGLLIMTSGFVKAGPVDDLLPPPTRQAEKRSLGANDENIQRSRYQNGGGLGASFSRDGKFLVTSSGYQGMTLWDVATGRAIGQLNSPSNGDGIAAAFMPDGKQLIPTNSRKHNQICPVGLWY